MCVLVDPKLIFFIMKLYFSPYFFLISMTENEVLRTITLLLLSQSLSFSILSSSYIYSIYTIMHLISRHEDEIHEISKRLSQPSTNQVCVIFMPLYQHRQHGDLSLIM